MNILTIKLNELIDKLKNSVQFKAELEELQSVLPFNRYEFILTTLLAKGKLKYEEYLDIRESYIDRNLYLSVFEISSPRGFGDTWAFGHLMQIDNRFKRPREYDPDSKGKYDLCIIRGSKIIKIEVKASRANDKDKPDEPLYIKALAFDSNKKFLMNYQQLKPSCCDVFLWIAIFRDIIKYWVIKSEIVQNHLLFSPQHRNEATELRVSGYKKSDIFEGQIMMTNENISLFDQYLCNSNELYNRIVSLIKPYSQYKK